MTAMLYYILHVVHETLCLYPDLTINNNNNNNNNNNTLI